MIDREYQDMPTQSVSLIWTEIPKSREMLESYREYNGFLDRFVSEAAEPGGIDSDPKVLVGKLDHEAGADVFLIEQCRPTTRRGDGSQPRQAGQAGSDKAGSDGRAGAGRWGEGTGGRSTVELLEPERVF
jgi:hypothetical protein